MNVQSMRFNRLDLNLLIGLDVLLTECSTTRAARRLCLSQSATSGILSRLREYFGDELLVQSGRKMAPTPLALSLMEPVREILLKIQKTVETAVEFQPETAVRHFRIVASDFVSSVVMTELARQVNIVAPFVTTEIRQPNERSIAQMERGEIDIVLMPERYLSRSYPSEVLFADEFSCIVWEGNKEVGAQLTETDYLRLGHVATSFGSHQDFAFDEWFFKSIGLNRRIEVVCSAFNLLPQFVIGTQRIATLQRQLATQLAKYYPIRVLKPPVPIPQIVECMQWHQSNQADPAHLWLRSMLRQAAQSAGGLGGGYRAVSDTQVPAAPISSWIGPVMPESRSEAWAS
ncbi:LysR family transcriptional regulator [Telluria mixta]|uniref:LysR family transcriptional regulator n=1 Tax=Telluria mixta TaxID=34071 RepID=A0ABT2BSF7_9BURK|nr:LysR family transcriptional regulator [Telluria mixta]MCS0627917.1 LysR family transcriptional regulator [Telluria mixta]WEM93964.1 LysR family transcriptional regulator [Telluria mixta]